MKKILFVFLGIILFTGCGSKKIMKCSYKSENDEASFDLSYIVKYKGYRVISVKSTERITSSNPEVIDFQKANAQSFYEPYSFVDYYNYNIQSDENSVTVTFDVDYTKVDFDELLMIDPDYIQLMDEDYVDIDQLKISYEDLGLECKK